MDTGSAVSPAALAAQLAQYALAAPNGTWPVVVVNANDTDLRLRRLNASSRPVTLPKADVYVIPGEMLGNMIGSSNHSQLAPITAQLLFNVSPNHVNLNWYGLDATLRLQAALYGIVTAGVPMSGSSAAQLYYRADVFERLGLAPEALNTWGSLIELAANYSGKDWDGDGLPEQSFCWQLSGAAARWLLEGGEGERRLTQGGWGSAAGRPTVRSVHGSATQGDD